jgi:hypothetical protein
LIDCCLLSRDQNFSYFQELRLSKETRGHNREIWLCNKPPTTTSYKMLLVKSCCTLSFMYQRRSIVHAACTHFCPALGRVVNFIHGVQLEMFTSSEARNRSTSQSDNLQNNTFVDYHDIRIIFVCFKDLIFLFCCFQTYYWSISPQQHKLFTDQYG